MKPEITLPPDVDARLIAERNAASARLRDLIHERGKREFTPDAERQVFRMDPGELASTQPGTGKISRR